jgi:PhnB protein
MGAPELLNSQPSFKGSQMTVTAVTHINLRGTARQALEFYQSVFGGQLAMVTYKDAHNVQDPSDAEHIMWGQVDSENGFRVMAYDVPVAMPWHQGENAYFVSVRGEAAEEITAQWKKLSQGSTIIRPLEPAQWSPLYGMLKDRFGVVWVLDVVAKYAGA